MRSSPYHKRPNTRCFHQEWEENSTDSTTMGSIKNSFRESSTPNSTSSQVKRPRPSRPTTETVWFFHKWLVELSLVTTERSSKNSKSSSIWLELILVNTLLPINQPLEKLLFWRTLRKKPAENNNALWLLIFYFY